MNREKILNMPAREIDALVAKYVMKLRWGDFIPKYSTDIALAMSVVEKIDYLYFQLSRHNAPLGYINHFEWVVKFGKERGVISPTAPLAICRAALLATMEVEE